MASVNVICHLNGLGYPNLQPPLPPEENLTPPFTNHHSPKPASTFTPLTRIIYHRDAEIAEF